MVNAINQRQTLFTLSMDTDKAFDGVWRQGLVVKLQNQDFQPEIIRLINSFMKDRYISVTIDNINSVWMPIEAGVPQGAVLSPLLYNLYVADMPIPTTPDTEAVHFADDQLLMAWGEQADEAARNLELFANQTKKYCDKWKIAINPEKCQFLKVTGILKYKSYRTRRLTKNATITIGGLQPQAVTALKYLGVTFTNRYEFQLHARKMAERCDKAYHAINHLFRNRNLHVDVKRTLYKTLIRPCATYAFSSWSSLSSAQMENLRANERRILRQIHLAHGRKPETGHFINSTLLYKDTDISRFDRVAFMNAVRFYRRAAECPNELVSKHFEEQTNAINDACAVTVVDSPLRLLGEFNSGDAFDGNGKLVYFHRAKSNGREVYNTNQNTTTDTLGNLI